MRYDREPKSLLLAFSSQSSANVSRPFTYHGSSKPLECFTELELAPDDPLVGTFSFCGKSTSISSSLELFELVGTVELDASISSAILFVSRAITLAPKIVLGPTFPADLVPAMVITADSLNTNFNQERDLNLVLPSFLELNNEIQGLCVFLIGRK